MEKSKYEEFQVALQDMLASTREPLTSVEIAQKCGLYGLEVSSQEASHFLTQLINRKRKRTLAPLARCESTAPGHAQWAYYNPEVCNPFALAKKAAPVDVAEPEDPAVNTVNPAFKFNPVELADAVPAVTVHQGVRSITVAAAGVTITVELTS